jgi:serine/threonine protein kinase
MGEPSAAPVREGDVLDDKYRVEKVLGQGGIGIVVAAKHLQLDRKVALKFLLPEILANAEIVARFSREARAAARLKSEHVTQVLDVGKLENGAPYMVMEYLEGCDLSRLLQAKGRLGVDEAVTYVVQACSAIAEAHAAGIVHRDLKPANLFLTTAADGSPRIKVLDFGISKSTIAMESMAAVSLTSSSAVIGTPLYMSPEQMQSARGVDGRADVWSLGAILYELIAGGPPFMAHSLPQLCIAVMQQEPRPLSEVRSNVPEGLSAVVTRCLTKERSVRFASVIELAEALAPFAPGDQQHIVRRISRASVPAPDPTTDVADDVHATLPAGADPKAKAAESRLAQTPQSGATIPLDQASPEALAAVRRSSAASSAPVVPLRRSPAWVWIAAAVGLVSAVVVVVLVTASGQEPRPDAANPEDQTSASIPDAPVDLGRPVVSPAPSAVPESGVAPAELESVTSARPEPPPRPAAVGAVRPRPQPRVEPKTTAPAAGDDLLSDRE